MYKKSRLNSAFSFSWLVALLLLLAGAAHAQGKPVLPQEIDWPKFDQFVKEKNESDVISGYSYLISGGLATIGGVIGYENSQDQFAKVVYALSQSIGIAAAGYGGYQLFVGNEYKHFHSTIAMTPGLSDTERNKLVANYFKVQKIQERKSRTVKAITHGLVAVLNFINAARESNGDLKTALYFVGGVNLLASVSFAF